MLQFTESKGLLAQYYNGRTGEIHAYPTKDEHQEYMKWYKDLTGVQQQCKNFEDSINESLAAKILVFTSEPTKFLTECSEHFGGKIGMNCESHKEDDEEDFPFHMINGAPHEFVEFLSPGISKGEGCRKLCQYMGVEMNEMIAFGDGENDIEF